MKEIGFLNLFSAAGAVWGAFALSSEFVCEGFHGADSAAGVVREGLIPGHLRKGEGFPDKFAGRRILA